MTAEPPRDARWARSGPARVIRGLLQIVVLVPVARFLTPVSCVGREFLRDIGPAVYVANHSSHVDTTACLLALGRRVRRRLVVAAAADYFYRSRAAGLFASLVLGTVPFHREGSSRESLALLKRLLADGWSVLIFPSGTRGAPPTQVKTGFAYVAVDAQVPVVPLWLTGPDQVMPKGTHLPLPGGVAVVIRKPIQPGNDYDELVGRVSALYAEIERETPAADERLD